MVENTLVTGIRENSMGKVSILTLKEKRSTESGNMESVLDG